MKTTKVRNAPLIRQWKLLLELDRTKHGLTFKQIAEASKCHERTSRRDVDTLTLSGFPVNVRTSNVGEPTRVFLERESWQGGEGTIFSRQGH